MATTFESYAALKSAMQDALADFVANRAGIAEFELATPGGASRRFKYTELSTLLKDLEEIGRLATAEAATATGISPRRSYAGFVGRR